MYRDAKVLYQEILLVTHTLPRQYERSIIDQVLRSSLSVVLNIAEGNGRSAAKDVDKQLDFFLNVTMGSLYETCAIVDLMRDNQLIDQKMFTRLDVQIREIGRQIAGFKKGLHKGTRR